MNAPVCTEHLELIPATREILESDLGDRSLLARHFNAAVPAAWPPPLMDESVIREFIRMSSETSGTVFAAWYWILDDRAAGRRVLIGNGGILGTESGPDTVVLGYSVLEEIPEPGLCNRSGPCTYTCDI